MVKQINVKFTRTETELQEWINAQNSASGSVKILIRQAIARYGKDIDINDALIRESITHATMPSHDVTQLNV